MPLQVSAVGAPGVQLSPGTPFTQVVVPAAAHAPTPQLVGWAVMPSSTWPLQSSSIPLQVSAVGVPGVQASPGTPFTQVVVPLAAHAPTPQEVGWATMPSSTWPLQLSSIPLQISAVGVPGVQLSPGTPFTQVVVPVEAQAPTPQAVACALMPSSTWPLQSSSIPLQVSAVGVPGVQVSPGTPFTQVVVPVEAHVPTPQMVGCPVMPSSTTPLQSSSIPLQVSAVGDPGVQLSPGTPFTQVVVPFEAHAPTPQMVGCAVMPSSTTPLQSSSIPLQVSAVGDPGVQVSPGTPFTQVVVPVEAHAPTPQAVGWAPMPSSTWPLQSSSIPLQVSAVGAPGVQLSPGTPFTQVVVPLAAHAPTPQEVGCAVMPSST
jgi:rubredoxin